MRVASGGLLYAAGVALAASAGGQTAFVLGWGVLCGLGQAGTAYAVMLAVLGRAAPEERRRQVLGAEAAAGSIGMFLLVPFSTGLIEAVGWRGALGDLAVSLSSCLFSLWPRPRMDLPSLHGQGTAVPSPSPMRLGATLPGSNATGRPTTTRPPHATATACARRC